MVVMTILVVLMLVDDTSEVSLKLECQEVIVEPNLQTQGITTVCHLSNFNNHTRRSFKL